MKLRPLCAKDDVGTEVIVVLDDLHLRVTKTRSVPWEVGHGDLLVLLEGKSGGYKMDRCWVVVTE